MTKRRDKGAGSVYQRASDGRWLGSIDLGWGADGKRRRKVVDTSATC
jgi:integrase